MITSHYTRFTLAVAIVALLAIIGVYYKTAHTVKHDTEHNFTIRANIARTYISLMQQHVDAMRRSFERQYYNQIDTRISYATPYSEFNVWGLSGYPSDGGVASLTGTATGTSPFPLSLSIQHELSAALSLNPHMDAIISKNKNVSWIYYTSAQKFIYLSPKLPIKDYQFTLDEYKRPFWYQAIAENNPAKRQIISDLYEDSVGKGLMITISSPVYIQEKCIGVVSLDLEIELLRQLTLIENIPGETIMVDENGKIVARQGVFPLHETYQKDHVRNSWHSTDDGNYWIEINVIDGELHLLQKINKMEFYVYIAKKSLLIWSLIVLIAFLFIFGMHYIISQKKITSSLRQSEEKNRALLEALPDTMFIMKRNGDFIDFYSPSNRSLLYSPEKFLGDNITNLFPEHISSIILSALERVFSHGKSEIVQYNLTFDGKEKNMESRMVLKNASEVLFIERDLTDQKTIEGLLHFERQQLLSLFDSIEAIIYVTDPVTNEILFVNKNFESLLGHPVLGKVCYKEFQNLSSPCPFCTNSIILAQKPNPYYWEFTNDILHKTYSIVDKIITWPDGRDVRFEMAVDISERKEAEEKNNALLRFQNEMLDTAAVWIDTLDLQGNITFWNRAAESISGYTREEIVGSAKIWDYLYPDPEYRMRVYAEAMAIISEKKYLENFETTIRTRTGDERVILWHSNIVYGDNEEPVGTIALGADITEQKKYQKALMENEARMELILKNSSDIIVMINAEGEQIYVSPSAETITGYTTSELIGKTFPEIVHPDDLPAIVAIWQDALANAVHTTRLQYRHIHKTKQWVHLEAIGQNLLGVPSIQAILLNIRDISDRISAENEKLKLQEQLSQSQKMESVGRLAGGVAHDFNNMLSVIIGHAELALAIIKPHDVLYTSIKEIDNAAKRSADLTRQLLAFARKQTISPIVLDVNHAIERVLTMLQRLIGEDISLVWKPHADMSHIKIDPSQLDQILANLCVNARDAIQGTGRVTIETHNKIIDSHFCITHTDVVPGKYLRISVSDTGCGMDKEAREHLFEPFYTTKEVGKGTGLGLATIYGIIRQNNGFIMVYSEKNIGTTFKIYLPIFDDVEPFEQVSETVTPSGNESILLVEDEQQLLDLTKTMLEKLGYSVYAYKNPSQAIEYFSAHAHDIHLIISDVVMPEMNGRELIHELLKINSSARYLYMSGYPADVIGHHGILDDTILFLQKPFSIRELAQKIRTVLGHNQ